MADQVILLENEYYDVLFRGTVSNEDPKARKLIFKQEPDGTLRAFALQVGADANGRERVVLVEDGRQLAEMLWGHDGTNPQRVRVETSRELALSLYGKDPTTAMAAFRTDASRILRERGFEPWRYVGPTLLTGAAGYQTVYTVPASTLAVIEWRVSGVVGNAKVDVHAVESAGAPSNTNAELINASVSPGTLSLRDGPLTLHAGGTIQARNTAAAGTFANIRVWVELYSTGDTV